MQTAGRVHLERWPSFYLLLPGVRITLPAAVLSVSCQLLATSLDSSGGRLFLVSELPSLEDGGSVKELTFTEYSGGACAARWCYSVSGRCGTERLCSAGESRACAQEVHP